MTCYACEKAPENPLIKFRGPPGCVGCDSRALAVVYGGMSKEIIDEQLHRVWPETRSFIEGRRMFWIWVAAIEKAKEKT